MSNSQKVVIVTGASRVTNNRLATLGLPGSVPTCIPRGDQFGVGIGVRHLCCHSRYDGT